MYLEPLKAEGVDEALHLANECVGRNLYSKEDFAAAVVDDGKFFLLLREDDGELAGYIYFLITSSHEVEQSVGLAPNSIPYSERCGRIQSIAIVERYRGNGLSEQLMDYAVKALEGRGVEAIYIVCWKPGGILPLKKALEKCGFAYLSTVKDAWYGDENLICPYCKGRCRCSADIYSKPLEKEVFGETSK